MVQSQASSVGRNPLFVLIAGSAIPLALVGGILGLWLADMSFSISAAIGFVALFGIAAMNGIMVLSCFNRLIDAAGW